MAHDDILIDTGIELPNTGWRGRALPNYPKGGDFPWKRMSVGDSFFVPLPDGGDIVRLMNRITGAACTHVGAGKVAARCVLENGRIGVRAWRVAEVEECDDERL